MVVSIIDGGYMKVRVTDLRRVVIEKLAKNLNSEQAEAVADYLLWADMSGISTQGVLKMTGTEPIQDIVPQYVPKILRDTKLSRIIDGGANPAPLVALEATNVAIEKAKEHGFGIVGVRNTYSSNGAQGYYADKIAENDLIGIVCSRSPAATTGFGSIDPLFGTNPIGFGFPTNDKPLVFDTATSAITWYGLVLAKAKGESIPENVAIDKEGNVTTDPSDAMSGALLSFGRGYKGAGFALVVELLAGPLIGGAFIDNQTFEEEWGTLIIAIDPELLVDRDQFKSATSELLRKVRTSRSAKNESIRLPGDHARVNYQNALELGEVDVPEEILIELNYPIS